MKKYVFHATLFVVLAAAAVAGPTVLAVKATGLPSLPNIFGMTLSDFLTWVVGSGVLGSIALFIVAQLGITNEILSDVVKGVLVAAATALITTLTPHIPPDLASQTIGQLILLLLGSIPAWLGFKFAALHYAASLRAAGFAMEAERTIQSVIVEKRG
jgi:hypothetical protein